MPDLDLWKQMCQLEIDQVPHVLATVVSVKGSTSAKVGSKALISADGKNLWGWVGGGCAEAFVIQESLEALEEKIPRTITADLDDEIFGLGMPCGGTMDIFLEPKLPPEKLRLRIAKSPALSTLLQHFGYSAETYSMKNTSSAQAILAELARALAEARGLPHISLLEQKGSQAKFQAPTLAPSELLILGHSRITEELAKLGTLLEWPTRIYGLNLDKSHYPSAATAEAAQAEYAGLNVKKNSYVVIASHHKGDAEFIRLSIEADAAYIGMVASTKRANLVMEFLKSQGCKNLERVRSPAGLYLACKNPKEIALSIVGELITG